MTVEIIMSAVISRCPSPVTSSVLKVGDCGSIHHFSPVVLVPCRCSCSVATSFQSGQECHQIVDLESESEVQVFRVGVGVRSQFSNPRVRVGVPQKIRTLHCWYDHDDDDEDVDDSVHDNDDDDDDDDDSKITMMTMRIMLTMTTVTMTMTMTV